MWLTFILQWWIMQVSIHRRKILIWNQVSAMGKLMQEMLTRKLMLVQAVFLLLGGCESPCPDIASQHNQRGSLDFPARCSQPQRAASLIRFRQKRKERCFDKKVRYGVRQEVALRMHRNKGQFTSAKKQDSANSGGKDQDSGQDDSQSETA
ncbi:hypothetical protein RIF29_28654 [Crotalaria pallida]|uniref:CCT domain-containing protein n=1 Tax=Crotalaria pallida TaxID=3830 RepID=A0AAN9HT60_CROPI